MLRRNLFDATDHFADEGICNIGHNTADKVRSLGNKASRVSVWLVPVFGSDLTNSVSGALADQRAVLERTGNGWVGNICQSRNFF